MAAVFSATSTAVFSATSTAIFSATAGDNSLISNLISSVESGIIFIIAGFISSTKVNEVSLFSIGDFGASLKSGNDFGASNLGKSSATIISSSVVSSR